MGNFRRIEEPHRISILEAMILLWNVMRACKDKEIGWQHAEKTFQQWINEMNVRVTISKDNLESALWACNMLHEKNKFWHPEGKTFRQFLAVLSKYKFHFDYNFLEGLDD